MTPILQEQDLSYIVLSRVEKQRLEGIMAVVYTFTI